MRSLGHHILCLATAILFAMASVVSASAMAPERSDPMRVAFLAATGGTDADICPGTDHGEAFHCPFCHGSDDIPSATPPDHPLTLWFATYTGPSGDLVRGPLMVCSAISARAPPLIG